MVNNTKIPKKNKKKIPMKKKNSSRAFLALFATAVFALLPLPHAWGYWGGARTVGGGARTTYTEVLSFYCYIDTKNKSKRYD